MRWSQIVTIIKRKVGASDQESDQESGQVSVQESDQVSVQEGDQVSVQEGDQENVQGKSVKISLTGSQRDIVNFCSVPRTAQEILDRLGLSQHSANRKRHIQPLLEMGVLEMTIPDNPNDRNQKYRKMIKKKTS